jgi:hypothetical protein
MTSDTATAPMISSNSAHIAWPVPSAISTCRRTLPPLLLLEGKEHLLRLLQEIPLGEAEHAAAEEDVADYEKLLLKLADVPTPAGPTQRQISTDLIQITTVRPPSNVAVPQELRTAP